MEAQDFPPGLVRYILWGAWGLWAALIIYGFATIRKSKRKQANLGKGASRRKRKRRTRERHQG